MGRIGDASPHHQEIHQNPTFDTSDNAPPPPPPPEEDLYEPPPGYQPPPPPPTNKPPPPPPQEVHSFPPPQGNDYDNASPHPFPPPQPDVMPPPQQFPPSQQHFPPPQQRTSLPNQLGQSQTHQNQNHNQNFPQQQMAQQGIPMGFAPSPFMVQQNQPWKSHLFDCMKNPQNAIITLFFPCVTFGQIAEVLDNGSTSCGTSGILYSVIACCFGMPCLMSCGYRSKLRAKFGLVESPAPDCLIHCFCEYCALCQEYRELEDRGVDPSIGHAGNLAKQQMMQQKFGMASPMPQRMMM